MKKQKFTTSSPKLKKVSIANLNAIKGVNGGSHHDQAMQETLKTHCCTVFPYCIPTLSTRPDSINPGGGDDRDDSGQ